MTTFLNEGDKIFIQGSGKKPYEVKKVGGVVSCSCLAWRNFGGTLDTRTCKHIKANIDPACLLVQQIGAQKPSDEQPKQRLTKTGKISTAVGGVVVKDTAPPCLRAHVWAEEDPTGWWMSEKLDGVRAWWNGTAFISRYGNTYFAPKELLDKMPKCTLDGELWVGRKQFQKTTRAVKDHIPNSEKWNDVKFVVYDAPETPGTFEERIEFAKSAIATNDSKIYVLEQIKCESLAHMKETLAVVEAMGGEGLVLRKPGSSYEEGKSSTCLKVKSYLDDEATVKGYTEGKGKHKGRLGALEVAWKGIEFQIGTGLSDEERKNPPAIGSLITFRYTGLTEAGVPKEARFIAERNYE